jgi:hypothetical protein
MLNWFTSIGVNTEHSDLRSFFNLFSLQGLGDASNTPSVKLPVQVMPDPSSPLVIMLVILIVLVGLAALLRFFLIPLWKKWKVQKARSYCPSILLPVLSGKLNRSMEIPSYKNDTIYKVNLFQLNCTCKRFVSHRGFYPSQDIRRLCRHLRKELENSKQLFEYSEVYQCIINNRVRDKCYEEVEINGSPVVIGFHPRSDFVRIYSRKKSSDSSKGGSTGPYEKFTLIYSQESWIYGSTPPSSAEIILTIGEMLKKYRGINDNLQGRYGL